MATTTATPQGTSLPGGYVADLAALFVGGSAFFIAVVLWFDNAQGGLTGNGVFHLARRVVGHVATALCRGRKNHTDRKSVV